MRLAIPVTDGLVAPVDGSCREVLVADLEHGQVKVRSYLENPGHGPGGPPVSWLRQVGVERMIACGVSDATLRNLQAEGISVIQGASGSPEQVLHEYVQGQLHAAETGKHEG